MMSRLCSEGRNFRWLRCALFVCSESIGVPCPFGGCWHWNKAKYIYMKLSLSPAEMCQREIVFLGTASRGGRWVSHDKEHDRLMTAKERMAILRQLCSHVCP